MAARLPRARCSGKSAARGPSSGKELASFFPFVLYHLLSLTKSRRVRLKVSTDEETPVPSVTGLRPVADDGVKWCAFDSANLPIIS
jgi:hypothetical protein